MKTTKRAFAALLTAVLLLTLLPMGALAEQTNVAPRATAYTSTPESRENFSLPSGTDPILTKVFMNGDIITFEPDVADGDPGTDDLFVGFRFDGADSDAYEVLESADAVHGTTYTKIQITSSVPVTFKYSGSFPTGAQPGKKTVNGIEYPICYRYHELELQTHYQSSYDISCDLNGAVCYTSTGAPVLSADTLTLDAGYSSYSFTITGRPYKEAYHFDGWSATNSPPLLDISISPVDANDQATVTVTLKRPLAATTVAKSITIVPKWTSTFRKTLVLNANGGTINGYSSRIVELPGFSGQFELTGYTPTHPDNKAFLGWYGNAAGTGNELTSYNITNADYTSTIYAKWGDTPTHTHDWASTWSRDDNYHWHECSAASCPVSENSGKDGYGAHVYDDEQDTTCNTCLYVRSVTPPSSAAPAIQEGMNVQWTQGSGTGLRFVSDADFDDFIRVEVDGSALSAGMYTVAPGSTEVVLSAAYLAALPVGSYTLGIVSANGTATTRFSIAAAGGADEPAPAPVPAVAVPQTGDGGHAGLWAALLLALGGALTAVVPAARRKRRQTRP